MLLRDDLICYEFNLLVSGANASPFLAQFVARKNDEIYRNEYPRNQEVVLKSTYMDDTMDSVVTESGYIEMYQQFSNHWKKAKMFAGKWLSKSSEVMDKIPIKNRASKVELHQSELPKVNL